MLNQQKDRLKENSIINQDVQQEFQKYSGIQDKIQQLLSKEQKQYDFSSEKKSETENSQDKYFENNKYLQQQFSPELSKNQQKNDQNGLNSTFEIKVLKEKFNNLERQIEEKQKNTKTLQQLVDQQNSDFKINYDSNQINEEDEFNDQQNQTFNNNDQAQEIQDFETSNNSSSTKQLQDYSCYFNQEDLSYISKDLQEKFKLYMSQKQFSGFNINSQQKLQDGLIYNNNQDLFKFFNNEEVQQIQLFQKYKKYKKKSQVYKKEIVKNIEVLEDNKILNKISRETIHALENENKQIKKQVLDTQLQLKKQNESNQLVLYQNSKLKNQIKEIQKEKQSQYMYSLEKQNEEYKIQQQEIKLQMKQIQHNDKQTEQMFKNLQNEYNDQMEQLQSQILVKDQRNDKKVKFLEEKLEDFQNRCLDIMQKVEFLGNEVENKEQILSTVVKENKGLKILNDQLNTANEILQAEKRNFILQQQSHQKKKVLGDFYSNSKYFNNGENLNQVHQQQNSLTDFTNYNIDEIQQQYTPKSQNQHADIEESDKKFSIKTFFGNPQIEVLSVKFDESDSYVASGNSDGSIKVFSFEKGKLEHHLQGSSGVSQLATTGLAWKPKTSLLYSVNADGSIICWNMKTGKFLEKTQENNCILCTDFNNDGSKLVTAGKDYKVRLYDEETLKNIKTYENGLEGYNGHTNRIFAAKFLNDDPNMLLTGGWDNEIFIWDIRQNEAIGTIPGPEISGQSIDYQNGTILVGNYRVQNQLELYDLKERRKIKDIDWQMNPEEKHGGVYCYCASFQKSKQDLSFIAGSMGDNALNFYNSQNGYKVEASVFDMHEPIYSCEFSNNSEKLAFGGGEGVVYVMGLQQKD
ncbi:WD40-repeat-containing domain [Pseudocohnilembus persalinus]|uniref:WD40-repeat-containing domain n=1 Tax=Pseudocohnilembus persalinus TaxID=266149 RepID=A0A0V0QJN6_PSEPJ|nr:WD40-repeat-containing domain [Pseudocohnilembus persalinus]|eukprot:KRX02418.1 WD40-repeat-containing domain [Pseudocohnilembus persalinus]